MNQELGSPEPEALTPEKKKFEELKKRCSNLLMMIVTQHADTKEFGATVDRTDLLVPEKRDPQLDYERTTKEKRVSVNYNNKSYTLTVVTSKFLQILPTNLTNNELSKKFAIGAMTEYEGPIVNSEIVRDYDFMPDNTIRILYMDTDENSALDVSPEQAQELYDTLQGIYTDMPKKSASQNDTPAVPEVE